MKYIMVCLLSMLLTVPAVAQNSEAKRKLLKMKLIIRKLQRDSGPSYGPTAVAGVRGDDVSTKARGVITPEELIWIE
jgi:hypothetical protein